MSPRYRVAILGCGQIAGGYDDGPESKSVSTHARAFFGRCDLVSAYDPDAQAADAFCRKWKIPVAAECVAEALRAKPDIVSVCSPNETHFALVQEVASHPVKAIFCEKPLALSAVEARAMEALCHERNILLVVNYLRRWDKTLQNLGSRILAGEFGKFQSVRVSYTKGVFHNASHAVNLLQPWLGELIEARVEKCEPSLMGDVLADFTLSFENCERVLFGSLDARSYNFFEIDIFLEKARIRLPNGGSSLEIQRQIGANLSAPESTIGTAHLAFTAVVDNLLDTLDGKASLAMPASEAVKSVAICEKVLSTWKEKNG